MGSDPPLSSDSAVAWVEDLVSALPPLQPIFREHQEFYGYVDPLLHLFFGEVSSWAVSEFDEHPDSAFLAELLAKLEEGALAGDLYIENLIGVSFVENIYGSALIQHLGTRLDEMARQLFPAQFS